MMFCSMILAGAVFALTTKATKHTRIMAGIFCGLWAAMCIWILYEGELVGEWISVFEWSFLMAFLGLCGILKSKKSEG